MSTDTTTAAALRVTSIAAGEAAIAAPEKKLAAMDLTSDVVVPLSVIIGLLVINVLVLLFIFRLRRRLPSGNQEMAEMEELGKILPSPDEKSRMDAERI